MFEKVYTKIEEKKFTKKNTSRFFGSLIFFKNFFPEKNHQNRSKKNCVGGATLCHATNKNIIVQGLVRNRYFGIF